MKNASKNLMKVDEFLTKIQSMDKNKPLDESKLKDTIMDLRDALNMLQPRD